MEDRSTVHIAILDGGSPESSAILELGKVVGSVFSSGHVLCVAAVWALHQSGSLCNWF